MAAPNFSFRALLVTCLVIAASARGDVVTDWNEAALQAIKTGKTPPPKAARALAILHTAIYDAVNGITQTHERYLVSGKPAGTASPAVAAAAAAHAVLVRLFPEQQASFEAAWQKTLAATPPSPERNNGQQWGEWTAQLILTARATDGGEDAAPYTVRTGAGEWQPTAPGSAPALLPQWAKVACFAMTSGAQFRPVAPPAITSAMYAFDFNLTKQLGSKDSTARTPEQTAIAQFWADGAGTVTPPGHWNVIARDFAGQRGWSLEENARVFALLNIALADAAICCWECKYAVRFWRPVTAIHEADVDRNPATEKDAAWTPLLVTPPFPEYTSGHSTFSSAAASVLAAVSGSDAVSFSATSEAMPGFSRSYHAFSEAAAEAGMSRIYGGIHFMSANQQGLLSGARLGAYVVENFLRVKTPITLASSAVAKTSERPSLEPVSAPAPPPATAAATAVIATPVIATPAASGRRFRPYASRVDPAHPPSPPPSQNNSALYLPPQRASQQ